MNQEGDQAPARDLYVREALSYVPHLTQLVDRNPYSPTYGCFDREYWHYRTLDFPFDEVAIASPPMTADWTFDQLLGYVSTWSAVAKCREVTAADPMVELEARLRPLWGDPARHRRVEWPITVRAGR